MKVEIVVPSSGESVSEGDIVRWFKESGDVVVMDEPLLELETDKASLEITAESDGQLEILEAVGATVKVGQVIGYINQNIQRKEGKISEATKELVGITKVSDQPEKIASKSTSSGVPSPSAKKLLVEHNIESSQIKGSGKGGRITKADVLSYLEARNNPQEMHPKKRKFTDFYNPNVPAISPDETVTLFRRPATSEIPREYNLPSETSTNLSRDSLSAKHTSNLSGLSQSETDDQENIPLKNSRLVRREKISRLRKTIAEHLVKAQHRAALLTTFNEIDMSAIKEIRRKYKDDFKEIHNSNLGILSFFTKAVCKALKTYPIINAQMDDSNITYFDYCDIGIAVATQKGLVVPTIRNAESMTFAEIESKIRKLAEKAKSGNLTLDELSGGTFTITNGGVFGSMLSTPIVNQPQSAVLGMHNIIDRPVAENGEVVIRPMMYAALTYDHRIIDGAEAVAFLAKVKALCEEPIKLTLDL